MVDTLNPPIEVILSWPQPNYVNPPNQGPALFVCCVLFSVLGIFIVSARIYSRLCLTRAPGSDDALIVLGLILTIGLSTLIAIGNKKFLNGRHIWDVPPSIYSGHRLNIWMCEWFYLGAAACIKISILLFYRRLSVSFSRGFKIATWAGIVYNIVVFVAFVVALLNLCRPLDAYWLSWNFSWRASHKFTCGHERISLPLSGALSMLGDLYSTLLPMFMIYSCVRSPTQRHGLYGLFGVGFLSVAAGIIRTYLLYRIMNVDYDFLPALWYMWITTVVELYLGIFAASAPALKPFLRKFIVVPVSKAKSSADRSTATRSQGPWNASAPWSRHSSSRDSAHMLDLEKVGTAHGFPEKIYPNTHTTWVEMQSPDDPRQTTNKRYSRLISFPEERSPSIDKIAIAR